MNRLNKITMIVVFIFILVSGAIIWFLNSDLSSSMDCSSVKFYLAAIIIIQLFSLMVMLIANEPEDEISN